MPILKSLKIRVYMVSDGQLCISVRSVLYLEQGCVLHGTRFTYSLHKLSEAILYIKIREFRVANICNCAHFKLGCLHCEHNFLLLSHTSRTQHPSCDDCLHIWTIRGKIIRTVLCCTVYDNRALSQAHSCQQFLNNGLLV